MSEMISVPREEFECLKEQLRKLSTEKEALQRDLLQTNKALKSKENSTRLKTLERLIAVLDTVPVVVFSIDKNGIFVLVEGYGLSRTEKKMENLSGQSALDLWGSFLLTEESGKTTSFKTVFHRIIAGEKQINGIGEYEGRHFYTCYAQLQDDLGAIDGIVGVSIDITERKLAEEELKEQKLLLEQIIEIIPVGLWITDKNGLITRGNNYSKKIWGGERLVGIDQFAQFKGWWPDSGKLIKPEEWAAARAIRKGETSLNEEIIIETFDGIRKTILNSSIPILDNSQQISGAIVVNQDITERKKTEVALRESEEIMRFIIKHDPNAIAVFDRDLRYIATSDRYLKDYNVLESNIVGKYHYDVFPEMPQKWKDVHKRALNGEIVRNDDDSFIRPDGSITYTRWECRPWFNANGEIGGMITYTEVITERKLAQLALSSEKEQLLKANESLDKANAQLKKLDQLKTDFVSVASHELRAPIASIIGFAQTLLSDEADISTSERKQYLHIIEKEGKRLGALVKDLLDLAKIEKGETDQHFEQFNIAELAREIVETILISTKVRVSVSVADTIKPLVFASRERIRQVLRNLLDNAIRYTPPDGSITVTIGLQKEEIIVAVKDTGTGIPQSDLDKVFNRFHRVKGMHGAKGEGSGLGLAIAKEIIGAHHGRIWVESTPGIGSTFFFSLPCIQKS
jgi:PAS domain S-box-containing protein